MSQLEDAGAAGVDRAARLSHGSDGRDRLADVHSIADAGEDHLRVVLNDQVTDRAGGAIVAKVKIRTLGQECIVLHHQGADAVRPDGSPQGVGDNAGLGHDQGAGGPRRQAQQERPVISQNRVSIEINRAAGAGAFGKVKRPVVNQRRVGQGQNLSREIGSSIPVAQREVAAIESGVVEAAGGDKPVVAIPTAQRQPTIHVQGGVGQDDSRAAVGRVTHPELRLAVVDLPAARPVKDDGARHDLVARVIATRELVGDRPGIRQGARTGLDETAPRGGHHLAGQGQIALQIQRIVEHQRVAAVVVLQIIAAIDRDIRPRIAQRAAIEHEVSGTGRGGANRAGDAAIGKVADHQRAAGQDHRAGEAIRDSHREERRALFIQADGCR